MPARASKELFVEWNEIRIVSTNCGRAGTLVFAAKTDGKTYQSVSICAFGREFKLDQKQLSLLDGFPLVSYGFEITHEDGWPQIGGYSVHFKWKRSRYSAGKVVQQRVTASVSEGGGLSVNGPYASEESKKGSGVFDIDVEIKGGGG